MKTDLQTIFGAIDIYLFDQLLKGRFDGCTTVLDAGCGNGRNLVYFLQNDFEVYGVDPDPSCIAEVKKLSAALAPSNALDHFLVTEIERMPFEAVFFDLIVCNAVLHFAKDPSHFDAMLNALWRVLKPGGFLFVRLASDIGIEHLVVELGNGNYRLPDGSTRFLVNEKMLERYTEQLDAELFDYLKTTNVQNLRAMTTWCIRKKQFV